LSGLERLWAGWRSEYVEGAAEEDDGGEDGCVFCRILASDDPPEKTYVVWRDDRCACVLNAYPYTSGHLMVMPVRHLSELEDVSPEEGLAVWRVLGDAVRALKDAYRPHGINVGANLGRPAGAGIPGHFHIHALPRWAGDTNFMTTVAETRVLPEALPITYEKVRAAWPRREEGEP
jgi:ATP adenylyltransferase